MGKTYEGEEWKHAKEEPPVVVMLTRSELQSRVDSDYATGRITLEKWRQKTDKLSEPDSKAI
jgi:hypothetical protein